ncbi:MULTISPECIES: CinA family protein [unclassified Ensifer]|uniref:CinA family protein n=1 Tax=unclassified Ensifer TaxID=2633371 RepID=UPI000813CCA1|nr:MULTISPECIES: CinA family protein [unclassified Ensifer]OCP00883.1 damage-inducible protein CinA [Ensifer sp. LC11]OCP01452.1 damage-inducible protein CinA [Ensifer sp. LC13]OCP02000.1 damage-inducible protein CinA [Ensifer sp. LC14]OCP30168.1 damage-inducible protein CinA [Ensifer sp. LC499]
MWPAEIEVRAGQIIARFTAKGFKVTTAESCTGGLIAAALTEISGSSAVVDRGFVTYSNEAKVAMLGVETATLVAHGAVSRQTAIEMAHGAVQQSAADFAVAVTGIAGPSGGSMEKPVGLVHLAAAGRNGTMLHREMHYGDVGRGNIRLATVSTALDMLVEIAQA